MLKHLPHFFSVPVSRGDEKKQAEKVFCKPVDLVKVVRGSHHPPQHHHRPPQHHSPFQSILEFSSFLYFPSKCMQCGFLKGFHLEKFSLHGRQDQQGPGVHFTRITAGLSQSPNLLTILQVAVIALDTLMFFCLSL